MAVNDIHYSPAWGEPRCADFVDGTGSEKCAILSSSNGLTTSDIEKVTCHGCLFYIIRVGEDANRKGNITT